MGKLELPSLERFCLKPTDFNVGVIGQIEEIAEDLTPDELMESLCMVTLKTYPNMSDNEDRYFESLLQKPSKMQKYKVELKPEFMEEDKRNHIWALTDSLDRLIKSMEHPRRYTFFRIP